MEKNNILKISKLSSQWQTSDPFIFCAHHKDAYPKGNSEMGPDASLYGRTIGNDFRGIDGWNMYHGDTIPGFPQHPHRGFETVTIVLNGYVDHADSAGATGRYGANDVQWLTAGRGCNHTEMFPLVNTEKENPLELFQIWLNLPKKDKFVEPHYKMLWAEDIPVINSKDNNGKTSTVKIISGTYNGTKSLEPSPNSWASKENNHVRICIIRMEPEASIELQKVSSTLNRTIYFYEGETISIEGTDIDVYNSVKLAGDEVIKVENGAKESCILLLEGEPIGEPVVSYGPFVMTSDKEIMDAFADYKSTGFGGWPWERDDFVHPREKGRFAQYPDGTTEFR
ncbi:pirin family protein [Clostridium beijerinckii]|uniref:Pirin family protein n=1 Tax=Clostridium beijerinckii TaxID=1520 RepID=A0A7X9SPL1_CLOBE|nr:pirin family protein [Clostridium beijerinckii]NMF05699.1 pirin family protein [Clostridium beijerinckii]